MHNIQCSVVNCSYNRNSECNAHTIQVGGKGAEECKETCCGTFLNSASYSNLAQYTDGRETVEAIMCRVDTCRHYENEHCRLDSIKVGCLERADVYTETECESFERNN